MSIKKPTAKPKLSAALVKKYSADPALRTKVPYAQLSPTFQALRKKNAATKKLSGQPITPGSTITNAQLERMAGSATDVQYGAQKSAQEKAITAAKQTAKDTSGWYDNYRQALAVHQANVEKIGQDATAGLANIGTGMAGLDRTPSMPGQSAENQTVAANAANVRQTLLGTFGALANQTGANANRYADAQTNVVSPGQKLQAQAQGAGAVKTASDNLTQLLGTIGAAKQNAKDTILSNEVKNILSAQALGLDTQKVQVAADDKDADRVSREKIAAANRKTTAANRRAAALQKGQTVNRWGYTAADWSRKTPAERQAIMKQFTADNRAPAKPKQKKPVLTPAAQVKTVAGIKTGAAAAKTIYTALATKMSPGAAQHQTRLVLLGQAKFNGEKSPYKLSFSDTNVAMDLAVNGYVSPANVKYLHSLSIDLSKNGLPYAKPKPRPLAGLTGGGKAKTS